MFDFTFHNPTKIIFGADKETLIGAELKAAGISRVLLVYGCNSVIKSGLLERVMSSLAASNIAWTQFGGVVSNPLLAHTREGVALAKQDQVEAILAVGGGSVLDEAKAIAVGALTALHYPDPGGHRQRDERQLGNHQCFSPPEIQYLLAPCLSEGLHPQPGTDPFRAP